MGKENNRYIKGSVLISSNHISFFDPILLLCVFWNRRVYSLATKDLYKNRFMEFLLNSVQCIQVDKENFSMNSFHQVTDKLQNGKAVLIFPEGQVNNQTDSLMTFKSGAVLMAHKSKAKILPVYISRGKHWYSENSVVIGDVIDIRKLCGDFPSMQSLKDASDYIHTKEKELEEYYIKNIKNNKEV